MKSLFVSRVGTAVLSLADVKQHLVVEFDADDALISHYMKAAHSYCENHTRRSIVVTRRKAAFDDFHDTIELPHPPIREIESITYKDSDGQDVALDTSLFEIDYFSDWGRIVPVSSWPSVKPGINRVVVQYLCGYGAYSSSTGSVQSGYPLRYGTAYGAGNTTSLSEDESTLKQAMYLLIAHWYENREAVVVGSNANSLPLGVDRLLSKFLVIRS